MAKYIIDSETLDGLGNAIRSVNGSSDKYTPDEMIDEVTNLLNAATFILVDKDGNEYSAAYLDSDYACTATANDIRKGTTAITATGMTEGTKEIPSYVTNEGVRAIPNGNALVIPLPDYDYMKLQAIVCQFNTNLVDSVSAEKVVIEGKVYPVKSTEVESSVYKDGVNGRVDLGITNDTGGMYLIRYFSYKEVY